MAQVLHPQGRQPDEYEPVVRPGVQEGQEHPGMYQE